MRFGFLQLSICLWNLILIGLQPVAAASSTYDYTIQRRSYRDIYDRVYRSIQNPAACSDYQIRTIHKGIAEAQQLANAAFSALRVTGAGTSRAFHSWFGASNAATQEPHLLSH
ncbi:hypothetical protein LZ32DRAFT_621230 [Colletotrichum eremochloae]|nr:hypothetical protein LZ32DRAFT_621230 [Colletotrichum eremochloae]